MYGEEWVAFYMLRGWDAGYERPSFGLLVDERHSGKGIGTLCLHAAMSECRLMGAASCMLKVAPGNLRARAIYGKAGFEFESVCPVTGHEILAVRWAGNPVEGKTGEG
jgi:RimJ/RimL family protein N-acetyltransferase